jgi:hypothetical protein
MVPLQVLASPGVDVSDTAADFVADGIITISGERKLEREDKGENAIRIESVYGAFARSSVLPDYADANGNHAETKDGRAAHSRTQNQDQEIRTRGDRGSLNQRAKRASGTVRQEARTRAL